MYTDNEKCVFLTWQKKVKVCITSFLRIFLQWGICKFYYSVFARRK